MVQIRSLPLQTAVAATRDLVEQLRTAAPSSTASALARQSVQTLMASTFGRCVLGLAGFLDYVDEKMRVFVKESAPSGESVHEMSELLLLFAAALDDEDNAMFIAASHRARVALFLTTATARIGSHPLLVRLMEHEDELIQEAAATAVSSCTSTTTGISFPHRARQLGSVERLSPLAVPLPLDARDGDKENVMSVLIRQVPTRMTGQPKTGYLLWGAAYVLARWVHVHRELFYDKSVLEVGSGLGLGGITAARYARRTVLTDYQDDTCRALEYNVQLNAGFIHEFDINVSKPPVVVEHLDWDNMDTIKPEQKMDVIVACDIICEPSTAEGFLRVVRNRLTPSGVAYLMNADSHSRFGVLHLHELLANAADLMSSITPVHELPEGKLLLETVADAQELSYEYYEIRLA